MTKRGLKYVYIDESGDVGLTNRSKPFFILTAVVASQKNVTRLRKSLTIYKQQLGWAENVEFKFSKTKKEIIKQALAIINSVNIDIYSIIYTKKNALELTNKQSTYNNLLAILLSHIPGDELSILIDGNPGKKYKRNVRTFIRKTISTKVIHSLNYANSTSDVMLQAADLVAGAKAKALQKTTNSNTFFKLVKSSERESFLI